MASFFAGVRDALSQSQEAFEAACLAFNATYDPEFPAGTGEKPRARGYHYKSGAGEGKRNKPGWSKLGDEEVAKLKGEAGDEAVLN